MWNWKEKISKSIATEKTNEKWENVHGEVIIYLAGRRELQINYLYRKVSERSRLVCRARPLNPRARGFSIVDPKAMRCPAANRSPGRMPGSEQPPPSRPFTSQHEFYEGKKPKQTNKKSSEFIPMEYCIMLNAIFFWDRIRMCLKFTWYSLIHKIPSARMWCWHLIYMIVWSENQSCGGDKERE